MTRYRNGPRVVTTSVVLDNKVRRVLSTTTKKTNKSPYSTWKKEKQWNSSSYSGFWSILPCGHYIKCILHVSSIHVILLDQVIQILQSKLRWIHSSKCKLPFNLHGLRNFAIMEKDAGSLDTKSWQAVTFQRKCGCFSAWPLISEVYFGRTLVPKVPLLRVSLSRSDQLHTVT